MRVLIINQWATNKGDRAICYFLLKVLVENGIKEVVVSTHDPAYWRQYPDIPEGITVSFVPTGWQILPKTAAKAVGRILDRMNHTAAKNLVFPLVRRALAEDRIPQCFSFLCNSRYYKAVVDADVVISTGGHSVTTINTPDAVGPQIYDLAVATLLGKPPILWSQSIGPFVFASQANQTLVQELLKRAPAIYIRNDASADEVEKMGVSVKKVTKTYESVFGLHCDDPGRRKPSEREKCIGVSVYPTNKKTPGAYQQYVNTMTGLVNHAISKGYRILFFPMELRGSDRKCIEDIVKASLNSHACSIEGFPPTMEHLAMISRCQAFIGHKTHSIVFSLASLTPLIAIAYHMKTHDFMKECELEEYSISDAEFGAQRGEAFDVNRLRSLFDQVIERGDEVYQTQCRIIPSLAQKVRDDFAMLIEGARKSYLNKGQ